MCPNNQCTQVYKNVGTLYHILSTWKKLNAHIKKMLSFFSVDNLLFSIINHCYKYECEWHICLVYVSYKLSDIIFENVFSNNLKSTKKENHKISENMFDCINVQTNIYYKWKFHNNYLLIY